MKGKVETAQSATEGFQGLLVLEVSDLSIKGCLVTDDRFQVPSYFEATKANLRGLILVSRTGLQLQHYLCL